MKKVSLMLMLLSAALFLDACTAREPDTKHTSVSIANANTNGTTHANNNRGEDMNTNKGLAPEGKTAPANHEKSVEIYLKDVGGKCVIEVPAAFQSVYLKRNKGKVRWIVYNNCDAASTANVVIENFGKNNSKPFGGDACDNKFTFDPIAKGDEGRLISKTGKVDGRFSYTIKVIAANGTIAELDPEIIVGTFDGD
jgi:hypothetical protein